MSVLFNYKMIYLHIRWSKLSLNDRIEIQEIVFQQWRKKKFTRVAGYIDVLAQKGFEVTRGYLQGMFKS